VMASSAAMVRSLLLNIGARFFMWCFCDDGWRWSSARRSFGVLWHLRCLFSVAERIVWKCETS
jgi:hypothetical protein